jgi:hypothetical protein
MHYGRRVIAQYAYAAAGCTVACLNFAKSFKKAIVLKKTPIFLRIYIYFLPRCVNLNE